MDLIKLLYPFGSNIIVKEMPTEKVLLGLLCSQSSSGRRCPERWLSFLSSKSRLNGSDIFRLPAEKI